ncbi:MAG: hypothetical protein SOZ77_01810 [Candidatus Limousia pullorum]|nr:hypothetical protein [Candidatus Limousia pullorum]
MLDKLGLEDAILSAFLKCLDYPETMDKIQTIVNNSENQIQQSQNYLNATNHSSNELTVKVNKILDNQNIIIDFIRQIPVEETKKEEKPSDELKKQVDKLNSENKRLLDDNNNLKTINEELIAAKEKHEREISKYSVFEDLAEIWECINSMSCDNKEYIERLCGSLDILAVLSLGRDEDKIEQLWSYLREVAVKYDAQKKEISELNRYFEFCLNTANSIKSEKEKYIICDIESGVEFETENYIKTADSKQIGTIGEVLVRSVKKGETIIFKAIVRVE